jgi:hypothetical protein
MLTVFLNALGEWIMNIMSKKFNMTEMYFDQGMIGPFGAEYYGEGREKWQRRFSGHFENAPTKITVVFRKPFVFHVIICKV